ncbi:hypothetical protein EV360DRAFT_89071 [Lentinula raphanica]|nr:hypothetical protein EV360DRAFT_89071 [Lentinula raphanica]
MVSMMQYLAGLLHGGIYGAEVIKIEAPKFKSIAKNKQSVAVDLRKPEGRACQMASNQERCDIRKLQARNSRKMGSRSGSCTSVIDTTLPSSSLCEAEPGSRYIHGFPDPENGGLSGPPVRPDISLGDSVAGLQAASGTLAEKSGHMLSIAVRSTSRKAIVPEYDHKGKVRDSFLLPFSHLNLGVVDRFVSHSSVTGIAPANAYICVPDIEAPTVPSFIVIGANGDSIYNRLMQVVECPDLTGPAVALGDLSKKIEVDASGEILDLKNTVNGMVIRLRALAAEVTRVTLKVGSQGKLGGEPTVPDVEGVWFELKIEIQVEGEMAALKTTVNSMVGQLGAFASEVGTQGILGGQARVEGVQGTWADLIRNVNKMALNLTNQVRYISEVTKAVAQVKWMYKARC